jgi:integrase/recombinase XerD
VVPRRKQPLVQPVVLAPAQVSEVLRAVKPIAPRTILTVAYAAGLRISEACGLCFEDIDSKSMVLHVRHGKGARERTVMLSPTLLHVLRNYYRERRPAGPQLFPGRDRRRALTRAAVSRALKVGIKRREIDLHITPHTMRHCFATQLLEDGVDIRTVQILLGHGSISSTTRYTHLTPARMGKIISPLDRLGNLTQPTTPQR